MTQSVKVTQPVSNRAEIWGQRLLTQAGRRGDELVGKALSEHPSSGGDVGLGSCLGTKGTSGVSQRLLGTEPKGSSPNH